MHFLLLLLLLYTILAVCTIGSVNKNTGICTHLPNSVVAISGPRLKPCIKSSLRFLWLSSAAAAAAADTGLIDVNVINENEIERKMMPFHNGEWHLVDDPVILRPRIFIRAPWDREAPFRFMSIVVDVHPCCVSFTSDCACGRKKA